MTAGLSKNVTTSGRTTTRIVLIGLLSIFFSFIFAGNYDFNKLSNLAKQKYGEEAYQDFQQLQQLTTQLQTASEIEKLNKINEFFNRKITFTDDVDVWGIADYWASPLEAIGLQAGDCEDFSIAKYVFLKAVNIPNEKLRLTYVRAVITNQQGQKSVRAHMVLSYYLTPQSEPMILDNLTPEILPASSRKDLSPVFSFNDKGLWVGNSTKPKSDSQSHLSRWRDVLNRMQSDGIE